MAIITRASKGSALTHTEMDNNLKQIPNGANSAITDDGTNVALKSGNIFDASLGDIQIAYATNSNEPMAKGQVDSDFMGKKYSIVSDANILISGSYRINSGATNSPNPSELFSLIIFGNEVNVVGQVAISRDSGKTYSRSYNGTSWTSWLALEPIGSGQSWQDVTSQRSSGVTYTNNTGKPIMVSIFTTSTAGYAGLYLWVDGLQVIVNVDWNSSLKRVGVNTIVPAGSTYVLPTLFGAIERWSELR